MRIRRLLLGFGILCLCAAPARAGGDGYDAADEAEGTGPVFYGVVRDSRGLGIAGAEVVLRAQQGDPVTLKSNILGMYRSHLGTEAPPAEVEVSCSKPGYRQSGVVRRPGQNARITETNCTLQRL
jgi:hypothetical protein